MSFVGRIWRLVEAHAISRITGRVSTASFWYLPEPPAVFDEDTLARYLRSEGGSPHYLMDYRAKLAYGETNGEGIVELCYPHPICRRVNPEAAFQYALALHDAYFRGNDARFRDRFLHYARWFCERQDPAGGWPYDFDWFESKAPWHSALAQSRGASVMLRAWRLTGERHFLERADAAVALFDRPVDSGGFLAQFCPANVPYFEEYPAHPTAVLNGFIASLFGLWELSHWGRSKRARSLWALAFPSLEHMLPHYTLEWWTLYDLDPRSPVSNVNSPRYHILCTDYLKVLAVLTGNQAIRKHLALWLSQDTRVNRARAALYKTVRKVVYR